MNSNTKFIWEGEVRDSELDFQGIVNNANYFVYMAHARHRHLKSLGIDCCTMHELGFDLLLKSATVDYKASLKSGDEFIVTSILEPVGRIRFVFCQDVIRKSDQKIVATGRNMGVCVARSSGRPFMPDALKILLQ